MKKQLSTLESFFYVVVCILSWGILWAFKIVIQKAIIDLQDKK